MCKKLFGGTFIYRIISLTKDNIDDLYELEKLCFKSPWTKNMLLGDILNKNTVYYAAVNFDGKIIGYAGMYVTLFDGQITNIAVHPDFRHKKIATNLLNSLYSVCKKNNLSSVLLEVREKNIGAIKLYEKEGFQTVGLRKNYYKNPDDNALLMTKTF